MGMGFSLIMIALGAILVWAIETDAEGWASVNTVGWILLGVGVFGALLSLVFWSSWGGFGRRETVVRERRR